MIEEEVKKWSELDNSGLMIMVNEFMGIFGWNIKIEKVLDRVVDVYPIKTNKESLLRESYISIIKYIRDNSDTLIERLSSQEPS